MIVRSGARFRGVAAAAVAAGLVAVAVVVAPVAAAAPAGRWAPAETAALGPGVLTDTAGGGSCTTNFVFTSANRTFLGQAAHCAGSGAATETNGCAADSGPLGSPVSITASDGTVRTGTLVYSSWLTMQELGEFDENVCQFNDLALVELDPADAADVNPSIPFFGGPTAVDRDGVALGEQVFSYGNSPLRMGLTELSPKTAVSAGDTGEGWAHEVFTFSPGIPGDSGSAYVNSAGEAIGVLSTLNVAPLPVSNGVIDIGRALDYANAHAGLGELVLELGTEPFTGGPLPVPAAPPLG